MHRPPPPSQHPSHPLSSLSDPSHSRQVPSSAPTGSAPPHPPQAAHHPLAGPSHSAMNTISPDSSAHEGQVSKKRKADGSGGGGGGGAAQHDSPGSTAGASMSGAKKRATLSCTECKRRKIKCDRKIPCLACVKRGDSDACRWSDEAPIKDAEVSPFALTADILKLATRLQSLEEWANQLPPELRASAPPPMPQSFVPGTYASKVKKGKEKGREREDGGRNGSTGGKRTKREESLHEDMEEEQSEPPSRALSLSDAEDAAQRLESIAFSARAPDSRYMPRDSLPFLDGWTSSSTHNNPTTNGGAELTRMRTSIVAPPICFDGPWSATAMGFDPVFTLDEFKSARRRTLDSLWRFMPDRNLSHKLLEKYCVEVAFLHNVLHLPSFEAEHERAWEMIDQGRRDEIDPMFVAVWCMILALALDGLRCQDSHIELSPDEQQRCHPLIWYSCAQRFMQLGDGLGRPQVRYIQVVILIGQWLQTSSCSGQAVRFLTLLASSIRTAQILGLHQLSDDPSHMPPPDPAWPPNACSVRRETALRLFGLLCFLDYISATTRFRGYILDPSQCSTPPVSNLDLNQLSIDDWQIEPYPSDIRTDSSFEAAKIAVCKAAREVFTEIVVSSEVFSYDAVTTLDAKYRRVLGGFEDARLSPTSTISSAAADWQRLVCIESAHFRILRLHRPFMLKHEYSKQCCLASAEKVIRLDLEVLATENNAWFAYSHALGAAICLFSDLFSAIDADLDEAEIERKKGILVLAFEVFGRDNIKLPQLKSVAQTGSRILSGLFMAEEKRRVTRAATALVPGSRTSEPAPESFTAVLQRLTREIAVQPASQPTPAVPTAPLPSLYSSAVPYPTQPSHPQAYAAPPPAAAASSTASLYPPPGGVDQSAFTLPFDIDDSYMPSAFLRDVGLTSVSGYGTGFDVFEPGNALGAAGGHFAVGVPQPFGMGGGPGASNGFYAPQQGGEWNFGDGTNGNGAGNGKMVASALLDELAGGTW